LERLVPTILALGGVLDSIFGPDLGNAFEATLGIRFIPDRHVALCKLLEILHGCDNSLVIHSLYLDAYLASPTS